MATRPKRVSGRKLVQVLGRFGWYVERHPERRSITLSLPVHANRTLPIGTQLDILRDAGITVEQLNREA